jgi:hypothetical protein
MLKLNCNIKISGKDNKDISFDYVNQIEVKTSCKNLTDTATVKVPKKMQWKEKPLTDFIERGNEISIHAGYDDDVKMLFKGYLTSIENNYPMTLKCENEMWLFKKITVPAEKIEKFDFKTYIEKYGKVKVNVAENLSFGSMDIKEEMSLSQALDLIMQTYPYVLGYFQDGEFWAILNTDQWNKASKPTVFSPSRNIISDNLKYTRADDVKIGIKAVSILQNNSRLEAYSPSQAFANKKIKDGWEQRQFFCPECKTQTELQSYADKMAAEFVTDSMSGSFTAFGTPFVRKGEAVELRDADRKERDGKRFIIDAVDYSFGAGGFRQIITLGQSIIN